MCDASTEVPVLDSNFLMKYLIMMLRLTLVNSKVFFYTWDIATFHLQKYPEFHNSVFGMGRIKYNNLILATHFAVGKVLLLKPRFR